MRVFTFILSIILSFLLFLSCGTENKPNHNFTATATPEEGGMIIPSIGEYVEGASLEVKALPTEGWKFVQWEGDLIGSENPIRFNINKEYNVKGVFESILKEGDVFNPVTQRIWMDRNLGASRVATSPTDAQSYGDLYQWGRDADGHQKRNSPITTTLSNSDQPGHGSFIRPTSGNYDWRSPQNNRLWNPTNNPCPIGYRVPSATEWDAELRSWSSRDSAGAFASPLRLPLAGDRLRDGSLRWAGSKGFYWSLSIPSGDALQAIYAERLYLFIHDASMGNQHRAAGYSVRCIKG